MPRTLNETDQRILDLARREDPTPTVGVNLHVHRVGEFEVRHTLGYHQHIHVWHLGQNVPGGRQVLNKSVWLDCVVPHPSPTAAA